jgi:pathogenesis-related protein 1
MSVWNHLQSPWWGVLPCLLLALGCGVSDEEEPVDGDPADTGAQVGAAGRNGQAGAPNVSSRAGAGGAPGASGGGGSNSLGMGGAASGSASIGDGETGVFVGITAAHNAVRSELGLPNLTWSSDLAVVAQDWADTLASDCGAFMHRQPNMYGENLAAQFSTGLNNPMTAEEAVDGWAAEVDCWTFGAIQRGEACEAACTQRLNASGCGHYTQIVWRSTREVGCGYARCNQSGGALMQIWVCNYDPPGNVIGREPY